MKILDVSLTRVCNYNCSWCNQRQDLTQPTFDMSESHRVVIDHAITPGREWIEGLNEFPYKDDYTKIIFTGGEPSIHPDFFDIVTKVEGYKHKMIISNLSFDVSALIKVCMEKNSYILVQPSFQFEFAKFEPFLAKMKLLDENRMLSRFIPVSIVDVPDSSKPRELKRRFKEHGFDASLFKFEGYYKGGFNYADIDGFGSRGKKPPVLCSSVCNCVRPNGNVTFCQTDTYKSDAQAFGNIFDKQYVDIPLKRVCHKYGRCHISSASWSMMESLETEETIWKGKNFRKNNTWNRMRNYCLQKNYRVLGRIKALKYRCREPICHSSERVL